MKNQFNFKIPEYISKLFDKYKYILLVCLVGMILVLMPSKGENKVEPVSGTEKLPQAQEFALGLESTLGSIDGVGRVKVVLTLKSGFESVYAYDTQENHASQGDNNSTATMVITSGGSGENPVVVKVNAPQYYGAVVVCDGGDSPVIKLKLTQAVGSLTGIKSDNITILKMKK